MYVLKECPPAQSIGKTVVDQGHLFVWDPREDVPYLVPPDDISRCTIKVPRRARINATRVVEYVPQYDETVIPKLADQPSNLQPVEAAASPGAAVDGDDAVSVADGELFEAEPPIPPPEAPPVPPHRDDEVPLADLADGEPSDERVLRAAANSPEHLRSTSQRIHSVGYVRLLRTPQRVLLANPMVVPMTGLTILLPRFNSSPLTVSSSRKEKNMRALESEG